MKNRDDSWELGVQMHEHVEDEGAYHNAVSGRIKNATYRKHLREAPERVHQLARNLLTKNGYWWKDEETGQEPTVESFYWLFADGQMDHLGFPAKMVATWVKYGKWSEGQAAAVERMFAKDEEWERKRAAEREAALPVPTGRVVVEGILLKLERRESDFGVQYKMLVKADDGWAVWGNQPKSLWDANVKDRIRFTATVEASPKDEKFGFFSRPTKGSVLASAEGEQ